MMSKFDWQSAVRELVRQFPELEKYQWHSVAHSLAYALARGNGDLGTPEVPLWDDLVDAGNIEETS